MSKRKYQEGLVPNDQGFQYYFGTLGANDRGEVTLWRDRKQLRKTSDMGELIGLYTDEALKFIREKKEEPFFLYLAHTMPHVKIGASDAFRGKSKGDLYGDVIEEMDANAGRIVDLLKELKLDQNTVVLFTSDNGPWSQPERREAFFKSHGGHVATGSAGPLRNAKGSSWEGGMRVPAIVWGPGRVAAGRVSEEMASTLDILPTFAALAGASAPTDRPLDGYDQSDFFLGKTEKSPRDRFFYFVQGELQAVRLGKWKLAIPRTKVHKFADTADAVKRPELYDLENDISEKNDVAADHPEVVQRLLAVAKNARETIVPSQTK